MRDKGERGGMMHARSCSFVGRSLTRASAPTPGKIAESRTRIKNHRPCPVASLLVPRRGAPVLPNRIHHNWHEKRTSERASERADQRTNERVGTGRDGLSNWLGRSRGRITCGIKERGNFGDKRDQRPGAEIDGNTDT